MEQATENLASDNSVKKSNRLTLGLLVLVFGTPPLIAFIMHYGGFFPEARSNHGNLVTPVISVPDVTMRSYQGKPVSIKDFSGKWTVLTIASQTCEQQACKKINYLVRQVKTAIGKDTAEVKRLMLIDGFNPNPAFDEFLTEHKNLKIGVGERVALDQLLSVFKRVVDDIYDRPFIVDPHGNLMMYYRKDMEPKELLDDLKRLILANP